MGNPLQYGMLTTLWKEKITILTYVMATVKVLYRWGFVQLRQIPDQSRVLVNNITSFSYYFIQSYETWALKPL